MLAAQGPSIPRRPTSNVVQAPPSIISSISSKITRVKGSRTKAVKMGSSICLKTSRTVRTSSNEAERITQSSAETIIMAGKISSRRRIIRGSPRLSSRPSTHKRSNVQGKVTSSETTNSSNTPTKESTSLTMAEKDNSSRPVHSISSSNLQCQT